MFCNGSQRFSPNIIICWIFIFVQIISSTQIPEYFIMIVVTVKQVDHDDQDQTDIPMQHKSCHKFAGQVAMNYKNLKSLIILGIVKRYII